MKRFGAYVARSWGLYSKQYLILMAIVAGVMIVPLVFLRVVEGDHISLNAIHDYGKFWTGILPNFYFIAFTMMTMKPLKNRFTLVMENTAPVSITEKWLFVILNSTVVAAILYALTMVVAASVGIMLFSQGTFGDYFTNDEWSVFPSLFLAVQSVAMFAGTMERRNHLVSLLLVVGTAFAAMIVLVAFPMWLSDRTGMAFDWGPMFTFGGGEAVSELSRVYVTGEPMVRTSGNYVDTITIGVCALTAIVFWLCSWLNFRERSIK
jgi:hypothetical protein